MKHLVCLTVMVFFLTSSVVPAQSFRGYTCSGNCSGHEAGYEWAEENDIEDEDDCSGNSQSFIEGCLAYVEEHQSLSQDYEYDDQEY
jgi:hypothetical protein